MYLFSIIMDSVVKPTEVYYYFQPLEMVDQSRIQMSDVSIYSTTPWKEAHFISRTIYNFYGQQGGRHKKLFEPRYGQGPVVTDATANVGGNTISFFLNGFQQVNAVEIDSTTHQMLINNLEVYHLSTQTTYCADYLNVYKQLQQDVVFIDPPWNGKDYIKKPSLDLYLSGINVVDLCHDLLHNNLASLVVLKVPINFNLEPLVSNKAPQQNILTHKIYRGPHHSYNIIFVW